jgi:hypothetical protein
MMVRVLSLLDKDNRFSSHVLHASFFLAMRFDLSITLRFSFRSSLIIILFVFALGRIWTHQFEGSIFIQMNETANDNGSLVAENPNNILS